MVYKLPLGLSKLNLDKSLFGGLFIPSSRNSAEMGSMALQTPFEYMQLE